MRAFTGIVVAALVACHGVIDDPLDADGVDELTFTPATASADGTAVVELAVIDTVAPPTDGKVVLATTLGTFLGGTSTITVALNDSGRAYAQLKAPNTEGLARVAATAGGVTKYYNVRFDLAATRGVIDLSASSRVALADGATVISILTTVDAQRRPSPYTVVLTTTAGSFLGGASALTITVAANDSGLARALLRVPIDSSIAIITGTSGGVTRSIELAFNPAPPTAVLLSGDFAVKAGVTNSAAFTALLLRNLGTPSPGAVVRFSADIPGSSGGTFGQFSPRSAISSTPIVSTRFTAGETAYRGPVVLRVHATRGAHTVTDSVTVQVVP